MGWRVLSLPEPFLNQRGKIAIKSKGHLMLLFLLSSLSFVALKPMLLPL
jgi:hypothetical protein